MPEEKWQNPEDFYKEPNSDEEVFDDEFLARQLQAEYTLEQERMAAKEEEERLAAYKSALAPKAKQVRAPAKRAQKR